MTHPSYISDEAGFTLTELLVVLALGGIILYLATASFLFSQQYVRHWDDQIHLLNATQLISQLITNELYQADTILEVEETQLSTRRRSGETREFSINNGRLMINNRIFNSSAAELTNLQFRPIYNSSPDESAGSSQTWIKGVELNFQLTIGADTMSAKRLVMLRQPIMWNHLSE